MNVGNQGSGWGGTGHREEAARRAVGKAGRQVGRRVGGRDGAPPGVCWCV